MDRDPFDASPVSVGASVVNDQKVPFPGQRGARQANGEFAHFGPSVLHGFLPGILGVQLRFMQHKFCLLRPGSAAVVTDSEFQNRGGCPIHVDHGDATIRQRDRGRRLTGKAAIPNLRPGASVVAGLSRMSIQVDGGFAIEGPEEIENPSIGQDNRALIPIE